MKLSLDLNKSRGSTGTLLKDTVIQKQMVCFAADWHDPDTGHQVVWSIVHYLLPNPENPIANANSLSGSSSSSSSDGDRSLCREDTVRHIDFTCLLSIEFEWMLDHGPCCHTRWRFVYSTNWNLRCQAPLSVKANDCQKTSDFLGIQVECDIYLRYMHQPLSVPSGGSLRVSHSEIWYNILQRLWIRSRFSNGKANFEL